MSSKVVSEYKIINLVDTATKNSNANLHDSYTQSNNQAFYETLYRKHGIMSSQHLS
jgi:hypothetical protein